MKDRLSLLNIIDFEELSKILKRIEFRGIYNENGSIAKPYAGAKFSLAKVYPPKGIGDSPIIVTEKKKDVLFSPQPTIYLNQTEIIRTVDTFLKGQGMRVNKMDHAVEYDWHGRGIFHMIPPVIEKHTFDLKTGFVDLNKLSKKFDNLYVKDSRDNLHKISDRYLSNFYIDEVSAMRHLDVFHSNAPIINYGIQFNGKQDFYMICDGSHRIDYAIEYLNEPINVILVEGKEKPLVPYYAFPMPFRPTIRLSSKRSEKMFPRLERDKIHMFNDFLKKTLHYDWQRAGLSVSRLRSNIE